MNLKNNRERIKGFVLAFMAGLLWGGTSPIAQFLFERKGVVSSWLVPYRLLTAGILLLGYAVVKRMNVTEMWKDKKDAVRLIAFAILGMMGMQYSFFSSDFVFCGRVPCKTKEKRDSGSTVFPGRYFPGGNPRESS